MAQQELSERPADSITPQRRSWRPSKGGRPGFGRLLLAISATLIALAGNSGCLSTETTSGVADALDSLGVSLRTIRESNVRFAYRDGLAVEEAADSIIETATDPAIRLEAYRWKMYSIPVIRQVYGQGDPIASRIDALALSMQIDSYFRTGIGRNRFGELQPIALGATEKILRRVRESLRLGITTANYDSLLYLTTRWAETHPLNNHVFERPSVVADMRDLIGTQESSIGSAVGRIADDVDDLSGRLSVFAAQIPREARWQGEYLLEDLAMKQRLTTLDSTLALLTESLRNMERGLLNGEIVVDIASLRSLHDDLRAALDMARTERGAVLADIERQRIATLEAVESRIERTITRTSQELEGLLDRLLWGAAITLAAGLAVVTLLVLYVSSASRKRTI